ncbi:MAG TPA: multifunctional oxoglutarate decarboxylase/oxoglutarate dehydrogenase thiamine pyrophosphate-binding subunit/dihydrolipoyllysine-residue succinyltransferase subunit [Ignavibacteria bacterium]
MKLDELNVQQREKLSEFGVNTWFVLDLLDNFSENPDSVSTDWQKFFHSINIGLKKGIDKVELKETHNKELEYPAISENEEASPIRGSGARIIENMNTSLSIPIATSLRTIPVKVLEENRRIVNQHFEKIRSKKISYTHIIGWAIVKALKKFPVMNYSFSTIEGEPFVIKKSDVNIGLAIDIEKKDGSRSLIVPNIKKSSEMNFKQYFDAYNDIIDRSRKNKIEVADFLGTTISLTNPGKIGTASSNPRLMVGQGTIIATGAIDFPTGFQAAAKDVISKLGISKVMNITSTYDHRIIQGAESGMFLKKISELINGENEFYEEIFSDLKIPLKPVVWAEDKNAEDFDKLNNIEEIEKHAKVIQMINMYRVRGHLLANLDPLHPKAQYHPELDPSHYGLTVWDYDRQFITDGIGGVRSAKLRDILEMLHKTYCDNIGVEYRHIQDPEEKHWLQSNMESIRNSPMFNSRIKKHVLFKLIQAENFEKFIDKKYLGHKRFSLEGSETVIPVVDYLLQEAADENVVEVMLGMSHRGRLNVLANIIGKPMHKIFSEFEEFLDPNTTHGSGDVKYHLGAAGEFISINGNSIKVSVASNPSHLEFVNPVVEGIVRAKQVRMKDKEKNKVIPVLLHGDAAFAGEGIVAETLNLSQLFGYRTGGTIHIIINNQIGFTTLPSDARSSVYATDVAKMVQAPIFHVNGDDPEAAMWVTKLAYEYRMKFNKDVVIDIFCYRRLGHNETDEPGFTQPVLYRLIKEHASVKSIYEKKLLDEKIISNEELIEMEEKIQKVLDGDFTKLHEDKYEFLDVPLAITNDEIDKLILDENTNISETSMALIVKGLTNFPSDFNIHPKLKKFVEYRKNYLKDESSIDWSFAEALAFGSLLLENIRVRLSGQDSARGTFSQRHLVFTDSINDKEIIPLNLIKEGQAIIEPLDSLLSEAAVLGFEFGYSVSDPLTLVMWEAQFGDFANAAQVIIDNFIVSSYTKWKLPNNLVMLLPHGQEGQGPEHSSARIERFLELCADNNMSVNIPTTPVQYFHILRKQMKSKDRKPSIIFTPKSLLRNPETRSSISEFTTGEFHTILDDNLDKAKINNIILTSGKIYYDLLKFRTENKIQNTAIIRLEQLYPFDNLKLSNFLKSYKNIPTIKWVQEEPENMGAWKYLYLKFNKYFAGEYKIECISRKESSSPAPGSYKLFTETQTQIMEKAFGL